MYPAVRKVLDDGKSIVDHEIAEHAEAEQLMKRLEKTEPQAPEFDQMVGQLISSVRHHIQDEEQDLLPRLSAACSAEQLRELGEKVLEAKRTAPTRPHPNAPNTPPTNKVLDPGLGLVDQMRDQLTGRG